MAPSFDLCVVFAEMRTGSNHLEAMLDAVPGLVGHGEVFNPVFVGRPNQETLFGYDLAKREADPKGLCQAIIAGSAPDLPILRFFHDHDARVLDEIMANPRVAKVILSRNPLDSYISRKIAAETGQWKMTDARSRKSAEVRFDAAEFEVMLAAWQGFAARLRRGLQAQGQTAFEITYEDLGDRDVLNGLLKFLGSHEEINPAASRLKPQNPGGPRGKVLNGPEMEAALARLDPWGLGRSNQAALARPAAVRNLIVSQAAGVMLLPVPGVADAALKSWHADGKSGLNQRELRQWMRKNPGHRKLSVVQHPLARAHDVFCSAVLPRRPGTKETRRLLRKRYGIALPQDWPDAGYDQATHLGAFTGFLEFLAACLGGQTSLAPEPEWSGQMSALQGMAGFALPDQIMRLEDAASELVGLAPEPGRDAPSLAEIYSPKLEALARQVYRRDYVFFGYGDWQA